MGQVTKLRLSRYLVLLLIAKPGNQTAAVSWLDPYTCIYIWDYGHLARYVKVCVAHASGMPAMFSQPTRVSDPDMHHGTCVMHVPWCMPESVTSGFPWSQWRGKRIPGACATLNFTYLVRGPWARFSHIHVYEAIFMIIWQLVAWYCSAQYGTWVNACHFWCFFFFHSSH